jgi:hypothetical protein
MSKIQPYSPIREPQKHVSHDRMQEILAKRSHAARPAKPEEAQSAWPTVSKDHAPEPPPPRSREPLQWQRREEGAFGARTVDEWYSWCMVVVDGKRTYETWTREPLTGGMKQLAVGLGSLVEAKAVAQADADAKAAP